MKNILLILVLSLISTFNLQAQPIAEFAPVGAEWWIKEPMEYADSTRHKVLHCYSAEEVTYQGQICRKVDIFSFNYRPELDLDNSIFLKSEYVYNNDDTVFYYSNRYNKFVPLYIFNVNADDTLSFYVPEHLEQYTTDTIFQVIVDSVYYMQLDSVQLQTVVLKQLDTNSNIGLGSNILNIAGYYSERIGAPKAIAFISHDTLNASTIDTLPPGVVCYSNSWQGFQAVYNYNPYPNTNTGCYYPIVWIPGASNREIKFSMSDISIFPNPTTDYFTIKKLSATIDIKGLTIRDITGKVIKTVKPTYINHYSIADLTTGMYIVEIATQEGNAYLKLNKR